MIGIHGRMLKKFAGSEKRIVVPEGVAYIGSYAFGRNDNRENPCPNLKEIILPETVNEIADFAFYRCETLEKIHLPKKMKSIGREAFHYCRSLKSITLPEGITKISYGTFESCYSLREISIPESVSKIESHAFIGCTLKKIVIPPQVWNLPPDAFSYYESIGEIVYQNISFSPIRRYEDGHVSGVNVPDCLKLIERHDISVNLPSPEKEYIIFQIYCCYPHDKEIIRFLKDNFCSKFRVLVDRNKPEIVRKILEYGELITQNNISSCIFYSVQCNTPEITLLLTDYKYRHFGYEDIKTVVERKFSL